MEKLKTDKKTLRAFGLTMAAACTVIALIIFLRGRHSSLPALTLAGGFLALGALLPGALKPAYIFWMRLAAVLAWINTRLILSLIFYLVMTPIGLVMRLLRIDLLERRIDKKKDSYWISVAPRPFERQDHERQF